MTLPHPVDTLPPVESPPEAAVQFAVGWILDHASTPVRYRALVDVAKLKAPPALLPSLVYSFKPGLLLAIRQELDGTFNRSMLGVPRSSSDQYSGVGTINAVRRLMELGWERDTPTLHSGRKVLFRLLAEDNDPRFLFELAKEATDADLVHHGRLVLREAAAAVLAQAGFEHDPRLRGCAQRILQRVGDFLASPLAEKPWLRVANKHILSPDASPPSISLIEMLAFMPHFRNERQEFVDMLFAYLSRPLPRQEVHQMVGSHVVANPRLVLGDPLATRAVADADVPFALHWLELMARLGFLQRHENWLRLFERFLDERDRDQVWRPGKGESELPSASPFAWPMYPLHERRSEHSVAAEVTFRLGLIARLSGRTIELV